MLVTIIILVLSAIFFMIGKIRSDLIALCSLILLVLFDILTPAEALSGFSNSVVIMMVGLFVVGGAIFQTGLAKMVSGKIMRTAGKNQFLLFILVMLVTSFVGAFVSNTGTVALMLPIVVSLANSADMSPSRLLMPLAFASSMGGMLTLIGTPPNLVIQEAIVDAGLEPLSFFSFTPVGLVCIAVGIIVLIPLSKWILSRKKRQAEDEKKSHPSMAELLREYQLEQRLFRVQVPADSTYCGKMLQELDISEKYGVGILEIRRKISTRRHFFNNIYDHITAGPHTVIQSGDILYLSGDAEHVSRMIGDNALWKLDTIYNTSESDKMNQTGVAEVLLLHNSSLHNVAVRDCGFREKFNINILGIQRNDTYYVHDLRDFRMHSGDALLIQGEWSDIARMSREQNDWVVLGQPIEQVAKVTIDRKAPVAAGIMLLMILAMIFDWVPAVMAVIIAAVLMVFTGCLRNVEDAYRTINWESIVLIAAMMPMSLALEKTGASSGISMALVSGLGEYGPLALLAGIYFTTSLMTMFISNTATAVLLAPIAMQSAVSLGVSPYPYLFAVTVAASMCFASPFSTPPNALVMSAGKYTFMDYVKVGLPLQLVIGIVMIFVLPLLFPF
ncbi:MAG TPA: SLC13 family permease [Candidatus Caccoplasma intestinavium]|uniref:SLC13 family permease n=1 Tax=Candidatus Caccoplasma intestinavium TaxID=2840716 RepID=A0A9D1KDF2_9BACT|nr:potassium uptake protein Trk family [Bacteroides sp. CAG:144]HIT40378.1 SLC13 family permease [Candidatus Caccoplasma intestinavium]